MTVEGFTACCVYGGDIDQDERFCQNSQVIREVGLTEPFAVAAVVKDSRCRLCTHQEQRRTMEELNLEQGVPAMDSTGAGKEALPKGLQDIPAKTIFKLEEAKFFMGSFVDAQGKLDRKIVLVLPDGRAFTTEKSDLPLTGVSPWFGRELHRNLRESGYEFKKTKEA